MTQNAVPEPPGMLGVWSMTRTIDDRHGHEQSTVEGIAELVLETDGRIRWSERGTLHRRSGEIPVSRTLYLESRDDGWWVTFEDGRDFHPWQIGDEFVHPCAPDTYTGRIDPLTRDQWMIKWRVSGPSKDYAMTTILTRAARPFASSE